MTCRAPEQGRFCSPYLLPRFLKEAALEAHDQYIKAALKQGRRAKPCIYDLHFIGGMASVCVYQGEIHSLCLKGTFPETECPVEVAIDTYKYLYFVLMQLQSCEEYDSVRELCPFLDDYDLIKLIQNRQYQVVKTYLKSVPVKEIPPAAMQESLLIELFVDAGWTLPLHILVQYYEMIFYKLYLHAVKSVLRRGVFERDDKYAEAKNRFIDFSLARREDDVYKLVVALP